ncbi:MAG: DUF1624 domain-containing protein [Caldilineae bacterium]|nr:MAG: DUF1624 domain-containing protein [Caldilineae bacterium]
MTDALPALTTRWSSRRRHPSRYWEVDMVRGVAIIMVVVYHLAWDLRALAGWDLELYTGFWHYFQHLTAGIFVFLVGLSLSISYGRLRTRRQRDGILPRRGQPPALVRYVRRSLKLLVWAGLISLVTWLVLGQGYIQFGILHFIAVSIVLAYPFLRWCRANLLIGLALLLLGPWIARQSVQTGWLIWLGLMPPGYYAVDYFPLIPWFGVVLLGVFAGNTFYAAGHRAFALPDWTDRPLVSPLRRLGQHTLTIYLVHQPVLIGLLLLAGVADLTQL